MKIALVLCGLVEFILRMVFLLVATVLMLPLIMLVTEYETRTLEVVLNPYAWYLAARRD